VTLYIIRHGESGENVGETRNDDSSLTARGREQARRTAEWLGSRRREAGFGADASHAGSSPPDSSHAGSSRPGSAPPVPSFVYTSPARRAVETAGPIAAACGAPLIVDPDLCESGLLYDAPGLSGAEVRAIAPEAILPESFPGDRGWAAGHEGESKPDLIARCDRVAAWLTATHPPGSGTIAIVSHAQFSGYLVGRLFGIPGETLSQNRIRLSNCGVTRLGFLPTRRSTSGRWGRRSSSGV